MVQQSKRILPGSYQSTLMSSDVFVCKLLRFFSCHYCGDGTLMFAQGYQSFQQKSSAVMGRFKNGIVFIDQKYT